MTDGTELNRKKISAVMIVQNEERHIARSLASLSWVDEIVIVDAFSSDGTKRIATDSAAPWSSRLKWTERKWTGFKDQRTQAMNAAINDWILVVDSDEECTPALRQRLESLLAEPNPHPAWKIRRQEFFLGKPISYGIWNPSYQDRFFNRTGVRYVNDIHEYPLFPVKAERIHEPLLHWPDFNPEVFLAKMNKYTSIEARNRVEAGRRTNAFRMITSGPAMFFKNYFYYRAYRDGMHGLAISVLEGVSRWVRHVKMWQYQRELRDAKGGTLQ